MHSESVPGTFAGRFLLLLQRELHRHGPDGVRRQLDFVRNMRSQYLSVAAQHRRHLLFSAGNLHGDDACGLPGAQSVASGVAHL
jgi:hypothetical protein